MDYRGLVTMEPGKRGGKPRIRGLRITVTDVLEYLASGMSTDEIVNDFPDLTAASPATGSTPMDMSETFGRSADDKAVVE